MKKSGQIELSFGMIFSIILVIVFLGFAFYGIKTFLGFQDSAKSGKFYDDLQTDIDRIWRSSQSAEQQEYIVPGSADYVCFVDFPSPAIGENSLFYSDLKRADYGSENVAFYPVKFTGLESKEILHLDISTTTENDNPLCIKTNNGKVSLTLKKDFGEALVTVTE